ncbi:MAG TPA: MFS transporter, partial [Nevskiaceae bacterium]|nr:MFS transporter [Nevskiaceae bacterium]
MHDVRAKDGIVPAAAPSPAVKLPLHTKFSLGLGATAFGVKDQGFNTLLMLYYNQVIGLPAAWVGGAIMLAMLVDAVADPLIGHWSDGLRSRWGRRHPFMYASALPIGLAYFLLWSPPEASHAVQFAYLLATAVSVRFAIACFEIPASALITEFTSDYDERTSLSSYRSVFYALGFVGMAIVTYKTVMQGGGDHQVGQLNAAGYIRYGWIAGPLMLVCVLLGALGTHDRIPTLPLAAAGGHRGLAGMAGDMRAIFFDRTLASLLLCAFFFAVVGGLSTTLGTYMYTYFWRFDAPQLATISGAGVWGMILGVLIAQLSRRYGKKLIATILYSGAIVTFTAPILAALLGLLPRDPAVALIFLAAQNALMITCVLGGLVLVTSMLADVGDYFQLKTGQRMEGLMFAAL